MRAYTELGQNCGRYLGACEGAAQVRRFRAIEAGMSADQKPEQQQKAKSAPTKSAISPTRSEDYPEWYQQVIKAADMAENSPVKGCMVIKPWGYGMWENIQKTLDGMFKDTGHVN